MNIKLDILLPPPPLIYLLEYYSLLLNKINNILHYWQDVLIQSRETHMIDKFCSPTM